MFRETFVAHLYEEEDARALRHFGRMLYAWVLEFSHYDPDPGEPLVRVAVRAAAADLRHLAGYLADAALEPSPEWPEAALVRQARAWAGQVGELAASMEAEVEASRQPLIPGLAPPGQAFLPGLAVPAPGSGAGSSSGADVPARTQAPGQSAIPGLAAPVAGSGSGAEPPGRPHAPGREAGLTAEDHTLFHARISLRADVYILQQLIRRLQAVRQSLPLPPEPTRSQALEEGDLEAYPALALAGDLDSFVDHLSQQARAMQRVAGAPGTPPAVEGGPGRGGHPATGEDPGPGGRS